jgi:hypothetical protein
MTACTTYYPDGRRATSKAPAVWTLAHRGYSGAGRLDIWVYPSERAALRAGAELALECGLDEDAQAMTHYRAGRYKPVLTRYEQLRPTDHVLRVQAAFLQPDPDAEAADAD